MKKIYQSKTFWVAILQGIAGALAAISFQNPELGGVLVAKSVLDVVLRISTDTPIGNELE